MKGVTLPTETVFVMEMSPIKFGLGAMDEVFTYAASPERHLRAAELLGARVTGLAESERREALPQALIAPRVDSPRGDAVLVSARAAYNE